MLVSAKVAEIVSLSPSVWWKLDSGGATMSVGIGVILRMIRQEWQLSLRVVEKRRLLFARERSNQSYQVSASWLHGLESEEHETDGQ
jgi:hypothetical protein